MALQALKVCEDSISKMETDDAIFRGQISA